MLHEKWEYNDTLALQNLVGFEAICQNCNLVHHMGFASAHNLSKEALHQFVKVNGLREKEARVLVKRAFEQWEKRSAITNWHQTLSWLSRHAGRYGLDARDILYLQGSLFRLSSEYYSELMDVPLVGYKRALLFKGMGIDTIEKLANTRKESLYSHPSVNQSKDGSFWSQIPMILQYAKALHENRTIVVGQAPLASSSDAPSILDLEYDPVQPLTFVIGVMAPDGKTQQWFAEDENQEKCALEEFITSSRAEDRCYVTYSSTSADEPILMSCMSKHGLPSEKLRQVRFLDLFYDVIFTQRNDRQKIFLPVRSMTAKYVSEYFGYREPKRLKIHDGLQALSAFQQYQRTRDSKLRKEILGYNRSDLERTALIFNKLKELSVSSMPRQPK